MGLHGLLQGYLYLYLPIIFNITTYFNYINVLVQFQFLMLVEITITIYFKQ
jgi:hypothetical protein